MIVDYLIMQDQVTKAEKIVYKLIITMFIPKKACFMQEKDLFMFFKYTKYIYKTHESLKKFII